MQVYFCRFYDFNVVLMSPTKEEYLLKMENVIYGFVVSQFPIERFVFARKAKRLL